MQGRSRVELYESIRRDRRLEGLSIRELARRHGVHRRTVRAALASAVPAPRKVPERPSPVLGPHEETIRAWIAADYDPEKKVPKKQRHTARRVHQRLCDEFDADVSESTVRRYVAQVRSEMAGQVTDVGIVQLHRPGAEAEMDFGEFHAVVDGERTKLYLFLMRLSASGAAFCRAYTTQTQEVFFDGHRRAFEHFGGVPGRCRYDNLKPAVVRVLKGRDRQEHERFVALRSHYGYDSFFCEPGEGGAHEKGGVEGEVGRFRRNHLVPVPALRSVTELNDTLITPALAADMDRHIDGRTESVGDAFAAEQPYLQRLCDEQFDCALELEPRVDAKSRVAVRQNFYSVPVRYAGRHLRVRLDADSVTAFGDGQVVARHERACGKGAQVLVLDHYLETLQRKPGALAGSAALDRARADGTFTDVHERFWAQARRRLGDQAGTRALVDVLLAHRVWPAEALNAGMAAAMAVDCVDPEVVVLEARLAATDRSPVPVPVGMDVTGYDRPAPTLDGYDTLLAGGER